MKKDVPNLCLSLDWKIIAVDCNFKWCVVHPYWQMVVSFQEMLHMVLLEAT